jgi:hypothetical protein
LTLSPQEKKEKLRELKFFLDEKNAKEVVLAKLLKAMKKTEKQIKNADNDDLTFNLLDPEKDRNSKINLIIIFNFLF